MSYANGHIPLSALTRCSTGRYLRSDAAASYERMALAFNRVFGPMYMTDAYRNYAEQVAVKKVKGRYAATPGTSNHGWGIAVDFASRINSHVSREHAWMDAHAAEYGWVNPIWASNSNPNDGMFEPWHWEYVPALDRHAGGVLAPRPPAPKPPEPPKRKADEMILFRSPAGAVIGVSGGIGMAIMAADYDRFLKAGVPVIQLSADGFKKVEKRYGA